MVVAPRATLAEVCEGKGGGLTDLVALLALQFAVVHLRAIMSAVSFMMDVSYTAGLSTLLNTLTQSVLYPVAGVFVGTVVASFAARGAGARGSAVDVVSLCALPVIGLDLALTLGSALSGYRPTAPVVTAATAVGSLWFVVLVGLGIRLLRDPQAGRGLRRNRAARGAGLAVVAILVALLAVNLIWLAQNRDRIGPVARGAVAPEIELPRHGGGTGRLSDLRGEVVLVDFWASWCGPCLEKMPHLVALERRLRKHGFRVLAINIEGAPEKVNKTPAARDLTVLLDVDGAAARRYGVQTLPHLVLVGRDGRVVYVQVGALGFDRAVAAVQRAVARPRRSGPDRRHSRPGS